MSHWPSRSRILEQVVSVFVLALIAATWKLWIPQQSFPQVPLVRWARSVPFWVDWLLILLCCIALVVVLVARQSRRLNSAAWLAASASMFGLMLLNQHRMQPWAYLAILAGLLFGTCTAVQAQNWLRWLVLSVYIYSAISKFDYLFAATLGQEFVEAGLGLVGLSAAHWPPTLRLWLALSLPIGELFVAFVLLIPRLRRGGVILGVGLHILLLLVLSPLGMDHRAGVLIWNLQFCALLVLLFWPATPPSDATEHPEAERPPWGVTASMASRAVAVCALFLPLLDAFNRWDHWLSWGLYSTRAPRVELYVSEDYVSKLPDDLQQVCSQATYSGYLRKFALDRWSLARLGVPIYPQDRFHTGLCIALMQNYDLDAVVAVQSGAPSRLTGERRQQRLTGKDEIEKSASRYWFNALPRDSFVGMPPVPRSNDP